MQVREADWLYELQHGPRGFILFDISTVIDSDFGIVRGKILQVFRAQEDIKAVVLFLLIVLVSIAKWASRAAPEANRVEENVTE